MITLKSEVEIEVYISVSSQVCIKHEDLNTGNESVVCMSKSRAIELSKALKAVASEVD